MYSHAGQGKHMPGTYRGQVGPGSERELVLPVLRAHAAVRQRPPREVQHLQHSTSGALSTLQMLDGDAT